MSSAPLMLSISGARGIIGESMTPSVAADFAAAFASFVRKTSGKEQPLICIGRDSRPSGASLAAAVINRLAAADCRVIDLGMVAAPTVGVMIDERRADGGMVVTASHNPGEWNGLKVLDATGAAPPAKDVERIIQLFKSRPDSQPTAEGRKPQAIQRDDSANDIHIQRILEAVDPEPIRAARLKVVLDSVNGAGCVAGRMLLESLGCFVVHINGEPTGEFAHTPEPLEENLRDLAARTRAEKAAIGFAQDPDADRLAVIDETGRYIGEEYTLVLAATRVLDIRRAAHGKTIAVNLSTSRMIDDLAAQYPGTTVVRSAVGEANVVTAIRETGAIVGGEGNGGVIFAPPEGVCWVRDSLSAMALILSLLAARTSTLTALVDQLPRYAMVKEKVNLTKRAGLAATGDLAPAIRSAIDRTVAAFPQGAIDTTDGVRIDLRGDRAGWVHLRPSNTEPIIRIIAEAPTQDEARRLVERVREIVMNTSARAGKTSKRQNAETSKSSAASRRE